MKKLKLKPQYEGLKITRNDIRIGKITFDANSVREEHYQNYKDLGFDIFDEVEDELPKELIKEIKELSKPKPKRPGRRKKNEE